MEEGGGRDVWASSMNVDEKNGSSGALTPEHWPAQIDAKQYVITRSTGMGLSHLKSPIPLFAFPSSSLLPPLVVRLFQMGNSNVRWITLNWSCLL